MTTPAVSSERRTPQWMLVALSLSCGAIIASWILDSVMVSVGYIPLYTNWFTTVREVVPPIGALGAFVVLAIYEGRRTMGLAGRSAVQFRATAEWTGWVFLVLASIYATIGWVMMHVLLPAVALGYSGGGDVADPLWFNVVASLHAGITEEIVVIAIGYRLLELVPWTIRGRAFALTGWATAILVATRFAYHTYVGLFSVAVIAFGWLSVRMFRHTRLIIPLIVAHTAWNLNLSVMAALGITNFAFRMGAAAAVGLAISAIAVALTRGPDDAILLGYPSRKLEERSPYYWANWRWQPPDLHRPPTPIQPAGATVTESTLTGTRRIKTGDVETAVHLLHRPTDRRTVMLVGTVHMAEASYYERLRRLVDDFVAEGAEVHYEASRTAPDESFRTSAEAAAVKLLDQSLDGIYQRAIDGFELPWVRQLDGPLAPASTWHNIDIRRLDTVRLLGPTVNGEFGRLTRVVAKAVATYRDELKPPKVREAVKRRFLLMYRITQSRLGPPKALLGAVNAARWVARKPRLGPTSTEIATFFTYREYQAVLAALEASKDVVMIWHGSHLPGIGGTLLRNGFEVRKTTWVLAIRAPRKGERP